MRGLVPRLPRPVAFAALLSFLLNVAGVGWGLPARFHPDEKADVAARMVDGRQLVPDSFVNPSLPLLAMMPVIAIQARLADAGILRSPLGDPLLAARVLSALAGAIAVLLLGCAVASAHREAATTAAFLLALAPAVVNLCHFATPEPWLLLATAAVLLLCVGHLDGQVPAWGLGLGLGLAASTKYTAAALVVPGLAALWLRARGPARRVDRLVWVAAGAPLLAVGIALTAGPGSRLAATLHLPDARLLHPESAAAFVAAAARVSLVLGCGALLAAAVAHARLLRSLVRAEVVAAGAAAIAGFLLGTPGALFAPVRFLSDLAFNSQTRHEYKGLVGASTSFGPYIGLLSDALTLPVLAAALLGLGVAAARAWRGGRVALVVLLAGLAPYVLVASSGHRALRFVAPVLPAAAWLSALALHAVGRPGPRRLLTATVLARSGVAALLVVRLFFVDSRLRAERWMERHIPRGATVDVITNHEGYAPRIPDGLGERRLHTLSREMAPRERFEEAAARYPSEASGWLVLTASFYQRFLDNADQMPERARFFRALLDGTGGFSVAARFHEEGWRRPAADEFLDPEIVILRRAPPSG